MLHVNVKKISYVFNYVYFNNSLNIVIDMSELNIEILKQIIEKLPNDFIVEFEDINGSTCIVSDNINIKVSEKKLTLRKH